MSVPNLATNPMSLGEITVTSGTPVSILANFPTYAGVKATKLGIHALAGNTSAVVLGVSSTFNYTTNVGAIYVIAKGASFELQVQSGVDKIDVGSFYIDGATNGDKVVAYLWQG